MCARARACIYIINYTIHSNNFSPTCKGLKTGMYYLRTRAAADAIKFTVDTSALNSVIYTSHGYEIMTDL